MEDLGLPMTKTHVTVDKYGNSASGTIPITLREAVDMGKVGRDSLVALTAFGAGLTYGATVMRWTRGGLDAQPKGTSLEVLAPIDKYPIT